MVSVERRDDVEVFSGDDEAVFVGGRQNFISSDGRACDRLRPHTRTVSAAAAVT